MLSVSWYLALGPPPVPTCPPAPDCGAPPLGERSLAARPSTCPGLMAPPVERTGGALGPSVCPDMTRPGLASWMEAGGPGRAGVAAPGHVGEASGGQ